jgi:hypothetical protein
MEHQTGSGMPAKSRFMPFMHVSQSGEIVRQLTPYWSAITMGTGIVLLVPLAVPFPCSGHVLKMVGIA